MMIINQILVTNVFPAFYKLHYLTCEGNRGDVNAVLS